MLGFLLCAISEPLRPRVLLVPENLCLLQRLAMPQRQEFQKPHDKYVGLQLLLRSKPSGSRYVRSSSWSDTPTEKWRTCELISH